MRKVVSGFGKKSCVSTGVRKPRKTCVTDRHDMTFAVKVVLNPNTINQPSTFLRIGQYSVQGLMLVIATGFIPLSPLSIVSTMGKKLVALKEYSAEYRLKEI